MMGRRAPSRAPSRRPGGAGRLPRRLLRVAGRHDRESRHRSRRVPRGVHERPSSARRVVHGVAGDRFDRAHADRRAPRCLRAVAVPVPRDGRRSGRSSLFPSCCRRSWWVPRSAASCPRALRPHGLGDPDRARLLQLRRRRARRRRTLGQPRSPSRRERGGARRVAVALVSARSTSRCSHRRSRRPARSSSSSRSHRSASSCCSEGPGIRRSRSRSTARPRSSSTCRSPPRWRSCSSSPSSRCSS